MKTIKRSADSCRSCCGDFSIRAASTDTHLAFTLIELLTVIAIIGILAAIILPVVGKVRESASKATFTSNMRQVGTAMMLFAGANKDRYPGVRGANTSYDLLGGQMPYREDTIVARSALQGPDHLGPYLGSTKVTVSGKIYHYTPQMDSPKMRAKYSPEDSVLLKCISLEKSVSVDGTTTNVVRPFGANTGANAMTTGNLAAQIPVSRRWMIHDYEPNDGNKPVHGSAFVAVFFDGHVESVPSDKMGTNGLIK